MRNKDYFKGKKVTVVGLARSGISCARLLAKSGAVVSVTDSQDTAATRAARSRLLTYGIKVELGQHTKGLIRGRDLIVASPGVSDKSLPLRWAAGLGIPVIGEIEAAWILSPAEVIAVTGSNGKTTVTTLIGMVLKEAGKRAVICGNIGNPFSREVDKLRNGDFVSLEVSSFQLETIRDFKPRIAVILNFSRNHLDRYHSMRQYLAAKTRIFINQDSDDFLVINRQDPVLKKAAGKARSRLVSFSPSAKFNANQAAVMVVSSILGIKRSNVLRVFRRFKGIEHRLEEAGKISGVRFINDSKSTTVDATVWALSNVDYPCILIAGGREKGNDYAPVRELVRRKVREAVLIGEARGRISRALGGIIPLHEAASLGEAVRIAFSRAASGESVLLSPMCKSFDMFANYEERGRVFKAAVRLLARGA
ncbi:MAG: UDP-N-acetylmuramoyl-L-alanine--D-glutamate ligase [Candidatus Omnitrophota bacterium]|jgi:UDP-N-acetylmuramoylalanine--D-glutamate ligase